MPSRRDILCSTLRATAGLALATGAPRMLPAAAPQQGIQHPGAPPDEMTVNTSQTQPHYPPPDFGPAPTELPPEARAVSGKNSLRTQAEKRGLMAGAAVVVRLLQSDPALAQLAAEQYGMLVPEAELKWVGLRPTQEAFNFTQPDALFAFANAHHMQIRGHTFVWHNSVPQWLRNGGSKLDVRQLLVDHIRTVATRYRGRVHSWDVVNEAILPADNQPNGLRKSFWYDSIGPDYIELAFRTAHEADTHAKLAYNDYGVEYDNEDNGKRRELILDLLRRLQQRRVPLHAVGIQGHVHAAARDPIGKGLADYIEAIRRMGLEVYITELDVNEDDILTTDVAERDRQVAETYGQFLDVALANPAVKLLLTWGISDRRTWLNDGPTHHRKQPDRPQRSLPFDAQYRPTPSFFALRDSIDRHKPHTSV